MTAIIFIMVIVMMFYYRTEKEVPYYENDISAKEKTEIKSSWIQKRE